MPLPSPVQLVVGVADHDVVAQEARRLAGRMGDERLLLRELQLELLTEEAGELLLDLLGFRLGTDEAQEPIIGVAHVAEASVVRVTGIVRGQEPPLLPQRCQLLDRSPPLGPGRGILGGLVGRIAPPSLSSVVGRHEDGLHKLIELVQVDVRKNGRADGTLRTSAVGGVLAPVLQVASPKHVPDQAQEATIVDLLG